METSPIQNSVKTLNSVDSSSQNQQQQQQPTLTAIVTPASTASNTINAASASAPTASNANVVTIPVPIVPQEDIYTYVAIKGSLHAQDCSIFGLNQEEITALSKRFTSGSTEIVNGIMIRTSPIEVINTISKLGYKVICSTGDAETVWTMQREI